MSNLGPNFYPKLVQISSEAGIKPEDLLAVMISESGMNPGAGKGNSAAGLIQFMPDTLRGVGFKGNQDDFRSLSGEAQLPYIKRLVQNNVKYNGGPFTSAAQYYVANFYPAALKLPGIRRGDPSTVFVEENPKYVLDGGRKYSKKYFDIGIKISPESERDAYRSNPLFHGKTPGAITYGDMINQVNKNKQNPLYQKALIVMKDAAGYKPNAEEGPMVATKDDLIKKYLEKYKDQDVYKSLTDEKNINVNNKPSSDLMSTLNNYLQQVSASEKNNKKLYKQFLPFNHMVIHVKSGNFAEAIEFSRVLCSVLNEELMAEASIHVKDEDVDVECSINGPSDACFETIKQLTSTLSNTFRVATAKIGGIQVKTQFSMNKKSSYQLIDATSIHNQHRKFLLKFV
jgi:hypothetical protein